MPTKRESYQRYILFHTIGKPLAERKGLCSPLHAFTWLPSVTQEGKKVVISKGSHNGWSQTSPLRKWCAHPDSTRCEAALISTSANISGSQGPLGALPQSCAPGDTPRESPPGQRSRPWWLLVWLNLKQLQLWVFFTHAKSVATTPLLEGRAKYTKSHVLWSQEHRTPQCSSEIVFSGNKLVICFPSPALLKSHTHIFLFLPCQSPSFTPQAQINRRILACAHRHTQQLEKGLIPEELDTLNSSQFQM